MPDRPLKKYSTEVFVLFPECNDIGRTMSAPYIKGYDFHFKSYTPNGVYDILRIIEFFDYEYIDYYYDKKNLEGLYYPDNLFEEYPFIDTMVRASFSQFGFNDWRTCLGIDRTDVMWNGNKSENDICAKDYERNSINTDTEEVHATLLSSNEAMVLVDNSISVTNQYKISFTIDVITTISEMYDWLCVNRIPQRRFDVDDKHGENGIGARPIPGRGTAGKLLCYRLHAQELLERAIGVGKESDLWYYDVDNQSIIYFENQNEKAQPAFHGYHMKPDDKGFENIDLDRLRLFQNNIPY